MALCKEAWKIVREVFPDLDPSMQNSIAWECTGYPEFWETNDRKSEFREQLLKVKGGSYEPPLEEALLYNLVYMNYVNKFNKFSIMASPSNINWS